MKDEEETEGGEGGAPVPRLHRRLPPAVHKQTCRRLSHSLHASFTLRFISRSTNSTSSIIRILLPASWKFHLR